MASRFEWINKRWGTGILIGEETYQRLEDKSIATAPVMTAICSSEPDVTLYVIEIGQPHQAPLPVLL